MVRKLQMHFSTLIKMLKRLGMLGKVEHQHTSGDLFNAFGTLTDELNAKPKN